MPARTDSQHDYTDASRGVRLQKVLAEAGVASRRECEAMIEEGVVEVNGSLVSSLPAWVDPHHDRIYVNGKRIKPAEQHVYVMLCKPRNVVCTNDDPEGRTCAIDLVKHKSRARLYPVGRLDFDSTGLLLLTNDGDLANRLTHPRHGVHKVYEVTVKGSLDESAIQKLAEGIFLYDKRSGAASRTTRSTLKLIKRDREKTKIRMELREGRNRQIRRMFAKLGHSVKRLRRISMGPLKLQGLRPGMWRDLSPDEVKELKRAAYRTDSSSRTHPAGKSARKETGKQSGKGRGKSPARR